MAATKQTLSVDKTIVAVAGVLTATVTPDASTTDVVTLVPLFSPWGLTQNLGYLAGSPPSVTGATLAGLSQATLTFTASAAPQTAPFTPNRPGVLQLVMSDTAGLQIVGSGVVVNFGNPVGGTFPAIGGNIVGGNIIGGNVVGQSGINLTTSGDNTIVGAVAGMRIYLIDYKISCTAGVSTYWKSSGGSILSSTTILPSGAVGFARSASAYPKLATQVGEGLVLNLSASVAVGVDVTFAIGP